MLSAQWFKVLNDLWSNKTRTVLIVLSITVGLAAVGMISHARTLLNRGVAQSYGAIHMANGSLSIYPPFDEDFLAAVERMPEVKAAGAVAMLGTRALDTNGQWRSLRIFSVPDYEDMHVNTLTPQSGAWPPPRHQILIDNACLKALGAQIGDELQIETTGGELRTLRIAGTLRELSQPPAAMLGVTYAYVDPETMEWLGGSAGFSNLRLITRAATGEEIQAVLDKVKNKAEKSGYSVSSTEVIEEIPINNVIQTLLLVLQSVGVLALFLSVFLIINTISAMITQQTHQIGVMKAVGGRTRQILIMYLAVVAFYGVIALALAIPAAIFGARGLSQYMASMFNFQIVDLRTDLQPIWIQSAIALLVPTLASLVPLLNGLHISATQALSGQLAPQARLDRALIDRWLSGANLWFARRLPVRSVILAMRNMFRRKTRLMLTLVTLILGGAVFVTVFNLRATIYQTMDRMLQMRKYDVQITFRQNHREQELRQQVAGIPGVAASDTWLQAQALRVRPDGSESETIAITAPRIGGPSLIGSPEILQGRWLNEQDENAMVVSANFLTDEGNLNVGDEITLKIDGLKYPFRIVGTTVGLRGYQAYVNYTYIAQLTHNPGRTNVLLVKLAPAAGLDTTRIKTALEERFTNSNLRLASIQGMSEERVTMQNNFNSILILLILMALLLALVGGLGLMGTMSINVLERTREIGVLRAIGASNGGVTRVFMLEGIAIGLISFLFAVPLSVPVTQWVAYQMGYFMTGTPWDGSFSATGIYLWLLIVFVISLLANYIPARSASRLTVREVLAYE